MALTKSRAYPVTKLLWTLSCDKVPFESDPRMHRTGEDRFIEYSMASLQIDDEDLTATTTCCAPLKSADLRRPVEVNELGSSSTFWTWPFFGPLLFQNESSDARDHCANERTFLSYLRLSVYMAVVSIAIVLSFHLKSQPSHFELRMAKPLGVIFWVLAVCCLLLGLGNYIKTVNKYSRKAAIVQTGWKTQLVLTIVAICIIGTCVVLLVVTKLSTDAGIR